MGRRSQNNWQEAEKLAAWHMQALGFIDARITGGVNDKGIDVESVEAAAQVKNFTSTSVGAPAVQQLIGAGHSKRFRLFYTSSTYTKAAYGCAADADVALFRYTLDGAVFGLNSAARGLEAVPRDSADQLCDFHSYLADEAAAWIEVGTLSSALAGVERQDLKGPYYLKLVLSSGRHLLEDPINALRLRFHETQRKLGACPSNATVRELRTIIRASESIGRELASAIGAEFGPTVRELDDRGLPMRDCYRMYYPDGREVLTIPALAERRRLNRIRDSHRRQ